jgi:hypothetical protein
MRARSWWWAALLVAMVPAMGAAVPRGGARAAAPQRAAQQPAPPAAGTQIEVLVIDASAGDSDAGLDRGLAALSQLRRAPFNMFTSMRLVSRTSLALAAEPARAALPDGTATVNLVSRGADGRYTFQVALAQGARSGNLTFVASAGEPVFTVRSSRADRAMILGFIVR